MAKKKKAGGHAAGGHGWFVTFADLMGLLVAFFVMLVAFSSQDQGKLQIVAGSMRDAFGVQPLTRYSGILEVDGIPTRPRLKNAARISPDEASATPSPDDKSRNFDRGSQLDNAGAFALASASLRQALNEMPELLELSKHIMIEETKQGLNIEIIDQDGRSMFPEGIEGTLRAYAPLGAAAREPIQAHALPHDHCRPHRRQQVAGQSRAMDHGICQPIAPTWCARFWRTRACRKIASS